MSMGNCAKHGPYIADTSADFGETWCPECGPYGCPHIDGTIKWGIASNKKWCDICKRFVQLKIDWSGHP